MQLSAFLDVALTLVAAYILLSLLCTTLNEFINMLLKTRANTLDQTVAALLDDPTLQADFRKNGLITSMQAGASAGQSGALPSYIDGRTFAHAVLGAIKPGQPVQSFQELEGLVSTLPDSKAKDALTAALTTAEQDLLKARDGIASWFDETMKRLSGTYVRQMKYLSLAIGFAIALVLNVDTFELGQAAWDDRVDVDAIDKMVQTVPANCQTATEPLQCQTAQMARLVGEIRAMPVGWFSFGPDPAPDTKAESKQQVAELGAVPTTRNDDQAENGWDRFWNWVWWIVRKFGGLACTAVAISLGAPFWFDVLKLVTNVRGAGAKPEPKAAP